MNGEERCRDGDCMETCSEVLCTLDTLEELIRSVRNVIGYLPPLEEKASLNLEVPNVPPEVLEAIDYSRVLAETKCDVIEVAA